MTRARSAWVPEVAVDDAEPLEIEAGAEPPGLGQPTGAGVGHGQHRLQVVDLRGDRAGTLEHPDRTPMVAVQREGDVLDGEDIGGIAVEPFRPEMGAAPRVEQLDVDEQPLARPANAPLHRVADIELARDLGRCDRTTLVAERRVARDHDQAGELGEAGDEIVGDAVREVLVRRLAAYVHERQHGDGRLRDGGCSRPQPQPPAIRASATRTAAASGTRRMPGRRRGLVSASSTR